MAAIMLLIALAHLLSPEKYLRESLLVLYYSYFSDFAIPFGVYFLLSLDTVRLPFVISRQAKGVLVFGVAAAVEVAQGFGVPLLGRTFDPLDFVMYAAGVLLAALVDGLLVGRLLSRLAHETGDPPDLAQRKALQPL